MPSSILLFRSCSFALIFWPSPSPSPPPVHRRTQRQEGSIDGLDNREWLLVQASQPEEAVTGFPLTAAAM